MFLWRHTKHQKLLTQKKFFHNYSISSNRQYLFVNMLCQNSSQDAWLMTGISTSNRQRSKRRERVKKRIFTYLFLLQKQSPSHLKLMTSKDLLTQKKKHSNHEGSNPHHHCEVSLNVGKSCSRSLHPCFGLLYTVVFDGDDDDGSIGFFHPLLLLRERERET